MLKKTLIIFLTALMFTPIYSVFAEEEKKDEVMNTITNNLALLNESSPIEINLDEITPDNPFVCEYYD